MEDQKLQTLANKFNTVSKAKGLSTKKCVDLKINKKYAVHSLLKKETSVGEAIIAVLGDAPYKHEDEPKMQVFLPKRFVEILSDEDLTTIPNGYFYLVSHGPSGTNSTEITLNVNSLCSK